MPGRNLTRPQFTKAAERIYFDDDDNDYDVDDNKGCPPSPNPQFF